MTLNSGFLLNNRYRIVSILGQGGMGAVYRAQDESLNIPVAVKENLFLSEEFTRQFQREATILANVKHPNLPRVIDYFIVPNQGQYLIMDYIEGEDLRQRIERINIVPQQDAILIGIEICNALNYLHNRKPSIVHRDIKPGNIKITPDSEIYLVDFGLAKIMQGTQVTITGARAMTPGYSPPEQYGTARTDARSDIYSLGATLYAALTGVIPEDGLARATGKSQLTPIRQMSSRIDRRLAAVIEKCLAVEPEDRYQSADDLKFALIEVGQLSQLTQQRPLVTPPPAGFHDNGSEPEKEISNNYSVQANNHNAKPISNRRWSYLILVVILGLVIGSSFYFNIPLPDVLSGSLSDRLHPSSASGSSDLSPDSSMTPVQMQVATSEPSALPTLLPTDIPPATQIPVTAQENPTSAPAVTPVGGGLGEISFVSKRTGTMQIWTMNSDGTHQRQLTNLTQGACQPNWSPDGTKLAIISPCYRKDLIYSDSKIYILDADGSKPEPLPVTQEGDFDPAWAPDGKRIAFSSIRTGLPHIFVYNFEEESLSEISDTRFSDIQPTWSPGGKQLAVARKNLYYHIWVISDLGQSQFQFSSSGNVNDLWPVWSYDNQFIMYGRSKETPVYPWLMMLNYEDRGTGTETRIPSLDEISFGPIAEAHLSPDQKWFSYEGWPDGHNHDIYIKSLVPGTDPIRLTSDPEMDFNPVWKPVPQIQYP